MSNNNTAAMDRQKRHMGLKASARISNTIIYVILVIMSFIWLIPFAFITIQSFRETPTNLTDYIFSPTEDKAITQTAADVLSQMGVSPLAKMLPPKAVKYVVEDYCIDLPDEMQ